MTRPALSRRPRLESLEDRTTPAVVTINGTAGVTDILVLKSITTDGMGDDTITYTLNGGADLTQTPGGTITQVNVALGTGAGTDRITLADTWGFNAAVTSADSEELFSEVADVSATLTASKAGSLTKGAGQAVTFTNLDTLAGKMGANNTLTATSAAAAAVAWSITADDGGTVYNVGFNNFGNLIGGAGDDTYTLVSPLVSIAGSIDGAGGNNTLTVSSTAAQGPVIWGGAGVGTRLGNNAGAVAGTDFSNIQNLKGGTGDDVFRLDTSSVFASVDGEGGTNTVDASSAAALIWQGTGTGSGSVTGVSFTDIQKLQGNLTDDRFELNFGVTFEIDGGSGTNAVAIVGTAGADTVTLKTGTATGLTYGRPAAADTTLTFAGINEVQARLGLGNDTLNIADTWAYAIQANFVNAAMEGTDTLNASSAASTFILTADNTGSLKQTAGPATSVLFSGLEKANGANGAFTNTVDAGATLMAGASLAWSGTGVNAGAVFGVDFTNAGKLQGNLADDTFDLAAGASFTEIDGGSGTSNTLKLASAAGSQVEWYGSGPNRGGVNDRSFAAPSGSITLAQIPGPASSDTLRLTSAGHTLKVGDTVILTGLDASPNSLKNATGAFVVKAVGTNAMGVATFDVDAPNASGTYVSGGSWRKATGFRQVQKLEGTAGDDKFLLQAPRADTIAQFASLEGGTGSDTVAALTDFVTTFTAANGFGGSIKIRPSGPTTNFSSIENYEGGGGNDTFDLSALNYADFAGVAAVNYSIKGNAGSDTVKYGFFLNNVLFVNFETNTATAIALFDTIEAFTGPPNQPGKVKGRAGGVTFGASNPTPDQDMDGTTVPSHWQKQTTKGLNIFFLRPGDAYDLSADSLGTILLVYQFHGSAATVNLAGASGTTASGFASPVPLPIVGIIGSPFEDTITGADVANVWTSQSTAGDLTYTIPFLGETVTATINVDLVTNKANVNNYVSTPLDPAAVGSITVTFQGITVANKGTVEFPSAGGGDPFQVSLVNVEKLVGGSMSDRFNLDANANYTSVDGAGGANTLRYASTSGTAVAWTGTGGTAGTIQGKAFDHMQFLVGGKGDDTFTIAASALFVEIKGAPDGEMSPGTDKLSILSKGTTAVAAGAIPSTNTLRITSVGHGLTVGDQVVLAGMSGLENANGLFTISAVTADTFDVAAANVTGVYGGGGTFTQQINWRGDSANAGFVIGMDFSAIGLLQGNLGHDTFVLNVGSSFASVHGGSGIGTLEAKTSRGHTARWTAGGAGGGAGGLGNNSGRVTRDDGMGNVDFTDFAAINNLDGGLGDDTFVFAPGTVFTSMDGGGDAVNTTIAQKSTNTFDYSGYSGQTVMVNFETAEATGLLLKSSGGGFTNITKVVGSAGFDQITGKSSLDNLWTSQAPFAGDLNPLPAAPMAMLPGTRNDVAFTGIEDLFGGAKRDVFELIGNTRFRMLDGGGFVGGDVNAILQTGTTQDDTITLRAGGISIQNATSGGVLDTLFANIQAVRLNFDASNDPTGTGGAGDDLMFIDYRGGSPAKSITANGGAGQDFLRLQAAPFGNFFYTLNAQALGVQTIGSAAVDDTILYQTLETMEINTGSGIDQFTASTLAYGADLALVRYINAGGGQDQANLLPSTTTAFFVHGGASDPRFGQGTGLFITGVTDRVDTGAIIQTPIIVSNRGYDGVYNFTNRKTISFTNIGRGVGGFFDLGGGGGLPGLLF